MTIHPSEKPKITSLFPSLTEAHIDKLLAHAEVKSYPKQSVLCEQGEYADTFFILLDGKVGIYLEWADRMHRIDSIKHGCFGEIALFIENRNRSATVITERDTRLVEISRKNFVKLSAAVPEFPQDVARLIIDRLVTTQDKLAVSQITPGRDTSVSQVMARGLFVQPVFGMPRNDRQFKSDIFVIMPFRDELEVVYQEHLVKVARELGLTIKRADELFSAKPILQDIWSSLHEARLIIAECTTMNPNVFYELGISHTLGKNTITITQHEEHVPFDLRQWRYIKYDPTTVTGMYQFDEDLRRAITNILKL